MSKPLRIGIAGAQLGAPHATAFARTSGAALVAIAEPDGGRLDALAAAFPEARRFESAEEMIASGELDAVVVASPTYLRERQVGAAFDAGLHVLCESPPGINGRESSHSFTSAGLVGKMFMWSSPGRFDPLQSEARRLVDAGELGEVFQGYARAHSTAFACESDSWRLDGERGGGALLQLGFAAMDAVWYAMGCPDPVMAMAARYDLLAKEFAGPRIERIAEDAVVGMVRFKNGACLQISAQASGHGPESDRSARIWGSKGSLDLLAGIRYAGSDSAAYAQAASPEARYAAQAVAFVEAIASGAEPPNTGKQALALMKMADALATSAKEREAVPIKAERSLEDLFGAL